MIYFCIYILILISLLAFSFVSGVLCYFVRKDTKVIKNEAFIFVANSISDKQIIYEYGSFCDIQSLLLNIDEVLRKINIKNKLLYYM
ncbi:MAG: hypothetical protein H6Q16_1993 [Bacteroidetes bacterium]|nr:hypothetical protein [Bacteroidota bacterium]